MKPDWESAPEWATHLAQDADRVWYWFEHKPQAAMKKWHLSKGRIKKATIEEKAWRHTLEERS